MSDAHHVPWDHRRPTIAFDLDSTLADYHGAMVREMARLAAPGEAYDTHGGPDEPPHLEARRDLIRLQPGFWLGLEPIPLAMRVLELAGAYGYQRYVVTKGPAFKPQAWAEKLEWCRRYLPHDVKVMVVEDKTTVFADVLVDDWPAYVRPWLERHPAGKVLMPRMYWNEAWEHPEVLLYHEYNLQEVVRWLALVRKAFPA